MNRALYNLLAGEVTELSEVLARAGAAVIAKRRGQGNPVTDRDAAGFAERLQEALHELLSDDVSAALDSEYYDKADLMSAETFAERVTAGRVDA